MGSKSDDRKVSLDGPLRIKVPIREVSVDISERSLSMTSTSSPLGIPSPRNLTALMQHLQLLVGREGHRRWCGGTVCREKFPAFLAKMSGRYPIHRNSRQRSYDRKNGRAVVHFVAFPQNDKVLWWLLSNEGVGGLADVRMEDARVARDAMASDGHIELGDYVLLYASKQELRVLADPITGKKKEFSKNLSTWTWKIRGEVLREIRASIAKCCEDDLLGADVAEKSHGLLGQLAALRRRPLFSGIRHQVYTLHKDAHELWLRHPGYRKDASSELIPSLTRTMPKMRRIQIFEVGTKRVTPSAVQPNSSSSNAKRTAP